jgi:hypothetical protein
VLFLTKVFVSYKIKLSNDTSTYQISIVNDNDIIKMSEN